GGKAERVAGAGRSPTRPMGMPSSSVSGSLSVRPQAVARAVLTPGSATSALVWATHRATSPTTREVTLAPFALVVATEWMPRSSNGWWVMSRSAPAERASSMTSRVGSTAACTRRTGWSGSPVTSPTRSQDWAVPVGNIASRAVSTSRRRISMWARPGSNRRRPRCKRGALPAELQAPARCAERHCVIAVPRSPTQPAASGGHRDEPPERLVVTAEVTGAARLPHERPRDAAGAVDEEGAAQGRAHALVEDPVAAGHLAVRPEVREQREEEALPVRP